MNWRHIQATFTSRKKGPVGDVRAFIPRDQQPHCSGRLRCWQCGNTAMHVWPESTPLRRLECKCGARGTLHEAGEDTAPQGDCVRCHCPAMSHPASNAPLAPEQNCLCGTCPGYEDANLAEKPDVYC